MERISLHIVARLGSKNEDYLCQMEIYFKIKFRDRTRAAEIDLHLDELNKEMDGLEKDLHEILDSLKKKVEFERADVDICSIADRLSSKYGIRRAKKLSSSIG